ncbi:FAD-dependent thymidylate synthase [Nocardiopsis sp. CT-R113]|uniref:Flavin-dependent thymidylate synthase n=1 Tax=Nocardiopsis codii TaxID=3065942 RepID=A0ABU7KD05_9ACTN|nr:FAD-dependent thymidylate synthase [Nocardiopsis sp. CT-R113]MEE2040110.1 FAD-dependent thymidylate synthase [Nocardiopsis sp. CT-R113]
MPHPTPHPATLEVLLIASTQVHTTPQLERRTPFDAEHLAEFAGRSCYLSWERPNPATAHTSDYLANIIRQGHLSVLEHATATFYITGVSRSLTHELIRHRLLSYSQVSQRFVDFSHAELITPPAARGDRAAWEILEDVTAFSRDAYRKLVDLFTERGYGRKQAREAARAVLPGGTATAIVVTGNHRAWREMIAKRNAPGADAEIRELAQELLRRLSGLAPAIYADMVKGPQ